MISCIYSIVCICASHLMFFTRDFLHFVNILQNIAHRSRFAYVPYTKIQYLIVYLGVW